MDWLTPLVGFLGWAIGFGSQEYRMRRERRDKYKDMVFEKRLEVHQGAYYRCNRLVGFMMPEKLVEDGGIEALADELSEYRVWINKNALYLAPDSKVKMHMFFHYAFKKGKQYADKEWIKTMNVEGETLELTRNLVEVLDSVERGVGVEYLPKERIEVEFSYLGEILGDAVESKERMIEKLRKREEKQKE